MAQQKYITPAQAAEAKRVPLKTVPDAGLAVDASYFVDVVRIQAERAGVPVATGGFRIYTTLDPLLQRAANSALVEGIEAVEAMPGYRHTKFAGRPKGNTDYLQGAVVAIDPSTGDVRALVGGRNYRESSFDRVIDGMRQPGSAFKPIVYAAAIADSLTANEIVPDTAIAIPLDRGRVYRPDNSDDQFLGPITMREALAKSRNVVAVQLAERVGMDTDRALGPAVRHRRADRALSLQRDRRIGSPAARSRRRVHRVRQPRLARRPALHLPDRGSRRRRGVHEPGRAASPVIDPKVAFIVRDMMRDVVERGTATSVRRYVPANIPVAGKTGTTNDNTDVWFVGMTPEIVAGVWLGFDKPKTITPGAAGGTLAAPIFGKMVADYYATQICGGVDAAGWPDCRRARSRYRPARRFDDAARPSLHRVLPRGHRAAATPSERLADVQGRPDHLLTLARHHARATGVAPRTNDVTRRGHCFLLLFGGFSILFGHERDLQHLLERLHRMELEQRFAPPPARPRCPPRSPSAG